VTSVNRRPSKPGAQRPAEQVSLEPPTPEELDAHSFRIGSDEYVLLSFSVGGDNPSLDEAAPLTPSERDVVARVLRGQSNSAIARERGTSSRTVANQLAMIYAKLGVRSRRELGARQGRAGRAT
jgi:DNA-binding CsgD family transcriptional regulator